MMAGIRGKNTAPELLLRKGLHSRGFRYRIHVPSLPGKPDLVLPKWNAAIFVHGCFWHRHTGCKLTSTPSTRREFWSSKFAETVERDLRNLTSLHEDGWRTAIVWECQLRGGVVDQTITDVIAWLVSDDRTAEFT